MRPRVGAEISTEGMSPRKASSVEAVDGSTFTSAYSRPSECYGGCGGDYVSGYPEWGDPDHNQIQVCVRREVAYIPDAGSDGNIVSAVEFARHYGQFWTPGKDGWIKYADRSFVEVEIESQEALCYQRAEVDLETGLVSGEFPSLLGKGVCQSVYGESMCHSVEVADITPRMTAKEEPPGRGEVSMCAVDSPRGGSSGVFVPLHSESGLSSLWTALCLELG